MAKELERAGLPTSLITPLYTLAEKVGANRIIKGKAIPHPVGDPTISLDEEHKLRLELVSQALQALKTDVKGPTVFND